MSKGLIVSGGHVNRDLLLSMLKNRSEWAAVVGVDGGMNPLWVIGVKPDWILGDFDSCDRHALEHFRKEKVKEIAFKAEKDMTDTELAIESLIEKGIDEAVLMGGTGSRLDHTFANMMLMFAYGDRIKLTLLNENNRITTGVSGMTLEKSGYKYLSLLPVSHQVRGVTLEGVKYPLVDATLIRESSYAVSNEIVADRGSLIFQEGKLLVIQSRD